MTTSPASPLPSLGVIIVTYRSSDVILPCLESVLASHLPGLRICVCDNGSPDDTVERIRAWAAGRAPFTWPADAPFPLSAPISKPVPFAEIAHEDGKRPDRGELPVVTLVRSRRNLGYAGGVNLALDYLQREKSLDLFWILNPDTIVAPQTAGAYVAAARSHGRFALMGGRTIYYEEPTKIQSDGGRVNPWTGICSSVNLGKPSLATPAPAASTLDYLSGANFVVSRQFLDHAGPMPEEYFLYYEEVDWAFRRGTLPLAYAAEAIVYHHCGTSIGSATLRRRASPFANYFNFRNRMRFMRRHHPGRAVVAYAYSLLKVIRLLSLGAWDEAGAAARGLFELPPPPEVFDRLSPDAAALAFAKRPAPAARTLV